METINENTATPYATPDPEFTGLMSSDEIWYAGEVNICLTDVIDEKAEIDHTHSEYVSINDLATLEGNLATLTDDLTALEDAIAAKADAEHSHNNYALSSHTHSDYVTWVAFDAINEDISSKADIGHTHTGVYDVYGAAADALLDANLYTDAAIDAIVGEGASVTLDTIGEIAAAIEDNQDAMDLLNAAIGNKANVVDLNSHASDAELHVAEAERIAWNAKSNFSGNYNDLTNKPAIPSINGLASEDYVDEKVDAITAESIGALPNTTVIPTVPTNVSAFTNDAGYLTEHQSLDGLASETYVNTQIDAIVIPDALSDLADDSTHRVVTDAEKAIWNAKSDFSGSYNDLTDKPSIPSISGLATETYVDEAVSTKADSGHTHTIANITNLQIALDSKAASGHNHSGVYADANHIHTASAVGAVASGDVATVSEVETYLGI